MILCSDGEINMKLGPFHVAMMVAVSCCNFTIFWIWFVCQYVVFAVWLSCCARSKTFSVVVAKQFGSEENNFIFFIYCIFFYLFPAKF